MVVGCISMRHFLHLVISMASFWCHNIFTYYYCLDYCVVDFGVLIYFQTKVSEDTSYLLILDQSVSPSSVIWVSADDPSGSPEGPSQSWSRRLLPSKDWYWLTDLHNCISLGRAVRVIFQWLHSYALLPPETLNFFTNVITVAARP